MGWTRRVQQTKSGEIIRRRLHEHLESGNHLILRQTQPAEMRSRYTRHNTIRCCCAHDTKPLTQLPSGVTESGLDRVNTPSSSGEVQPCAIFLRGVRQPGQHHAIGHIEFALSVSNRETFLLNLFNLLRQKHQTISRVETYRGLR